VECGGHAAALETMKRRPTSSESLRAANAGRPLVKATTVDVPAKPRRLGFLKDEIAVPEDFNRMSEREIATLFGIE
jgi:hypothetical protein